MTHLNPEAVDLAIVAQQLRAEHGAPIEGAIVGRTLLRDMVTRYLACSQLEAERIVDTMIGRGFIVPDRRQDGMVVWRLESFATDSSGTC